MSSYNGNANQNLEIAERMVKRYLWFLVDDYHFSYHDFGFRSEKIHMVIEIRRMLPTILIYQIGEPDFTRLPLEEIIDYFEHSSSYELVDITVGTLERNIQWYADKLRKHGTRIINEIDDWWIPVHVLHYNKMKDELKDIFLKNHRNFHDYLKRKGAM